ncbi:hypothetical protein RFI_29204 [Reticulomyxa filosa]|uniref:Uncharacterized protein n=1 Tax=Reticulomyxa filosa TaxID=46433 RepID=X6M2P3_RETFI|nr:hypothetical protein RFI_29204 [Reticulomyxa filosa]|eukprot:ETO08184.1 hypothetical protein RFI_29204 [Reticulomyxa filosa]
MPQQKEDSHCCQKLSLPQTKTKEHSKEANKKCCVFEWWIRRTATRDIVGSNRRYSGTINICVFVHEKEFTLFEDLAKFMKDLPTASKKHIWEHAINKKNKKKNKTKIEKTSEQKQITKVLCDCVIIYVKVIYFIFFYLNRKQKTMKIDTVLPHVEPAAQWIFKKYKFLEKHRFEQESTYFADMLQEYHVLFYFCFYCNTIFSCIQLFFIFCICLG